MGKIFIAITTILITAAGIYFYPKAPESTERSAPPEEVLNQATILDKSATKFSITVPEYFKESFITGPLNENSIAVNFYPHENSKAQLLIVRPSAASLVNNQLHLELDVPKQLALKYKWLRVAYDHKGKKYLTHMTSTANALGNNANTKPIFIRIQPLVPKTIACPAGAPAGLKLSLIVTKEAQSFIKADKQYGISVVHKTERTDDSDKVSTYPIDDPVIVPGKTLLNGNLNIVLPLSSGVHNSKDLSSVYNIGFYTCEDNVKPFLCVIRANALSSINALEWLILADDLERPDSLCPGQTIKAILIPSEADIYKMQQEAPTFFKK